MDLSSSGSVVVVGGGQAGAWAAKTLRDVGFRGRVTLFGGERHFPYERPSLSKSTLLDEVLEEPIWALPNDSYAAIGVDVRRNDPVIKLDPVSRRVISGSGATVEYDRLILSMGGSARRLQIVGAELSEIFTLRSLDDALLLRHKLRKARTIAVAGGGWIGLEVAAAARRLGVEVVLFESSERLCARAVPVSISEYIQRFHTSSGVRIVLRAEIKEIYPMSDGRLRCHISDGSVADVCGVVTGIGLHANDELARDAGLLTDRGIVVDEFCRTSDRFIYAAGDVARGPLRIGDLPVRLESWQNAQDQAIAAAKNSVGISTEYRPIPWFWSDQSGLLVQIYGVPSMGDRYVRRNGPTDGFIEFSLREGRVVGLVGINSGRDLRSAKRLVDCNARVDESTLADSRIPLSEFKSTIG